MRRFVHWLNETNTTALFNYGKDFQVDQARGDWDVSDYDDSDGDKHEKYKPWEIENALHAEKRRNDILRWAKAGFLGLEEVVTDKSIPLVPKWQSEKR